MDLAIFRMRPWITLQDTLLMIQQILFSNYGLSHAQAVSEVSSTLKDLVSAMGSDSYFKWYRLLGEDALKIIVTLNDVHLLQMPSPASSRGFDNRFQSLKQNACTEDSGKTKFF